MYLLDVLEFHDYNWEDIVTPIQVNELARLLKLAKYLENKTDYLVNGFRNGFDLGYWGPKCRKDTSANIPFKKGVASPLEMWNKIMKEVGERRYAGPFKDLPTQYYMQSPIGLVPKAGGKKRLIFHLSFDFGQQDCQQSFNWHTPEHLCSVKYQDLDEAVRKSLQLLKAMNATTLCYAKSECSNAFRIVPASRLVRFVLFMKAQHPVTSEWFYFIDKCLPFGVSISCAIFQSFLDALKHLTEWKISCTLYVIPILNNYLDDFLFIAITITGCNQMVEQFLIISKMVGCPISMEKTEWGTPILTFLGLLLNVKSLTLAIPLEKRNKAHEMVSRAIQKKKLTIKEIQKMTGLLNFLNRAIVPGRAFTQAMYAKLRVNNKKLKSHHHVSLNKEYIQDCRVWVTFLANTTNIKLCQPFIDLQAGESYQLTNFHSDASKSRILGMGAVFQDSWVFGLWPEKFIEICDPSIEFLELYALTVAIVAWQNTPELKNRRVVLFCDNEAVMHMVNQSSLSCLQCMKLIRILTLGDINFNRRIKSTISEVRKIFSQIL